MRVVGQRTVNAKKEGVSLENKTRGRTFCEDKGT